MQDKPASGDVSRETFGPEAFAQAANVSRETLKLLQTYASMLVEWNAHTNLVSQSSLPSLWQRHFWDSAQLVPLIPKGAKTVADLGSGAGFPGLILGIMLRDRPGLTVALYESIGKKARFLVAVCQRLGLSVEVRNIRIEDETTRKFEVITARACAPLVLLLPYAQRFWARDTVGLFLKGQTVVAELTEARKSWRMKAQLHASRSDPSGQIIEVRELEAL